MSRHFHIELEFPDKKCNLGVKCVWMQELVGALHWYHGGIVNLKNTGTTSCRLVSPNPYFNSLCVFMYEFMDYISCFIHMNSYTCEFLFMNSYMICIHEFIFM